MAILTHSQKMALTAFERIEERKLSQAYASFARAFPALLHNSGLAQACAFALANQHTDYLADLLAVLSHIDDQLPTEAAPFIKETCTLEVHSYIHLSRQALRAAVWLKRYAEAREAESEDVV